MTYDTALPHARLAALMGEELAHLLPKSETEIEFEANSAVFREEAYNEVLAHLKSRRPVISISDIADETELAPAMRYYVEALLYRNAFSKKDDKYHVLYMDSWKKYNQSLDRLTPSLTGGGQADGSLSITIERR